jgi:GT2 family glycosyltransferase
MKNVEISFIIPHWKHNDLLFECISSIRSELEYIKGEIIIIDNASLDNSSAEHIRVSFHDVKCVRNSSNLGYAKAVNQGVKLSSKDFLFLLNNDTILLKNTSENLLSFLLKHPDAGAVAPVLYYPDGKPQISCRRFPTPAALLLEYLDIDKFGPFHRWKLKIKEHMKTGVVQQPMMSALMIRRECWDAVGPLDERFPIFFNDVDWCYRLYKYTNYKIYLCPGAGVIHHHGASTNIMGYRKKIEWYKGLIRFYIKHGFLLR